MSERMDIAEWHDRSLRRLESGWAEQARQGGMAATLAELAAPWFRKRLQVIAEHAPDPAEAERLWTLACDEWKSTRMDGQAGDDEIDAQTLLARAVKLALESERPKVVAGWLRGAAESVEQGEFEE